MRRLLIAAVLCVVAMTVRAQPRLDFTKLPSCLGPPEMCKSWGQQQIKERQQQVTIRQQQQQAESRAEPPFNSGNAMIDGCVIGREAVAANRLEYAGFCDGVLHILGRYGDKFGICAPAGATYGESARVVLRFMKMHPQRLHKAFTYLAIVALRQAWPCQESKKSESSKAP